MAIGSSDDDYHLRFQVVDPELTVEQDQLHGEAMTLLKEALAAGCSWSQASESLKVVKGELKAVVLADFLKILLAERHFQGGERLKGIAKELGVPMEMLVALKESMIREVQESSQRAYRLSQSQPVEN
ncbi:MAG: hypothetical protein HQL94_04935 [Magnetococcales bacterium]|nr:hypothetical protein [Magnetococcales bacterium]MBF0439760.1 hypothetical protein [Magnetococcales bacterium]